MKAFWWFKENTVAGMARPGFNAIHWLDLPFDEAVVMGWIGQHSQGPLSLESFQQHLRTYVPKMFFFHQLSPEAGHRMLEIYKHHQGLLDVLERLNQRTGFLEDFHINDDQFHFKLSDPRLEQEISFLKDHGISEIVSLTELPHRKDFLKDHFKLRHIGIQDLEAPTLEQVAELAQMIQLSRERNEGLAVHCMAGIGRTSTMLLAAHLVLGEKPDELEVLIQRQNPKFVLAGPQRDLIHSLSGK